MKARKGRARKARKRRAPSAPTARASAPAPRLDLEGPRLGGLERNPSLLSFALLALLALLGQACGGASGEGGEGRTVLIEIDQGETRGPSPDPIEEEHLHELLPPGAEAVVDCRPSEVMEAQALREVALAIFQPARLERFARQNGVDPRTLGRLIWAAYGRHGSVVIARGPFDARAVVRANGDRMVPIEARSELPYVRRVGLIREAHRDLTALDEHTLLLIGGSPQLSGAVLRRARRPAGVRHAFSEPAAAAQHRLYAAQPFSFFAPEPLGLPTDTGVGLLLARERSLAVGARGAEPSEPAEPAEPAEPSEPAEPAQEDAREEASGPNVDLVVDLRGEFPPGAGQNFRSLVGSVAASDLGQALGLGEVVRSLRVEATGEQVTLRGQARSATVAAGLHLTLRAEMQELIGDEDEEAP